MSRGIADFFREFPKYWQNRAGEIRFTVEVTTAACITFRLDGEDVVVNWGDGRISEETDPTGRCHHSYKEAGIYHIIISGRDIINLEVKRCNILSLDVQACPTIEFIDCSENFLTELDVYNCKYLYELYCDGNRIRKLLLGKYYKLFYLSCSSNELEEVKLDGCRHLVNFRCRRNNLRTLDVSRCSKLVSVNVEYNKLDYINLIFFLSTLPSRPVGDLGYIVFRNNIEVEYYDNNFVKNIINSKGWREV